MMPSCPKCGKILSAKSAKACQEHKVMPPCSDETKEKLRVAHAGKTLSKEHREKLRLSHLGQIPWSKGSKGLVKAWNKGLKGCFSEETRKKMSLARLGKEPSNKGIFRITLDNGYEKKIIDGKKQRIHRVKMEEKIGRPLIPREVVHHIDGNRGNNNPENLLLFRKKGAHTRLHQFASRHGLDIKDLGFEQSWLIPELTSV